MASSILTLSMKMSSKVNRRMSASFENIRNARQESAFPRHDRDSLLNELSELFSYTELIELVNGWRMICCMGWDTGLDLLIGTGDVCTLLVGEISVPDQARRISALEILSVFMLGATRRSSRTEMDRIADAKSASVRLIQFGLLKEAVGSLNVAVSAMRDLQLSGRGGNPMDSVYKINKEIRLCLNIILLFLILHPTNNQVITLLSAKSFGGRFLIVFCLDLISSENADLFPLKKLTMAVRLMMSITYGGISSPDFDDEYLKKMKSRRRDVFQIYKHISENFGPVLCIPNSAHPNGIEIVTFSRTPKALVHRAETARKYIHIGYSDTEDIILEDIYHPESQKLEENAFEKLYRMLYPQLRQYVVGILKLLLSIAPNVRSSTQMVDTSNELMISSDIPDLSKTVERARHTEILTKNIAFVLLSLLKTFRRGNPLQFTYLLCLLQDKNALIVILKFLNQNMSSSLAKKNEIPSLSPFQDELWCLDRATIIDRILQAKPTQGENCWRKYSAYVNMLRTLQKITKNSPRQIRSLVKFRAPEILNKLLQIQQLDIVVYTLKLLKSQTAFMDARWRTENVNVISGIFLHVRIDLFDTWLVSVSSAEDVLEAENTLAKTIRQHCQLFNSKTQPEIQKSPLFCLPENAGDNEILVAALAEHPPVLSKDFLTNWRQWLQQEGLLYKSQN